MTVNVPLLRKAVEWAEAEAAKPPELCEWEQHYYVVPTDIEQAEELETGYTWWQGTRAKKATDCGTCYCIAGYVASLSGEKFTYSTADDIATDQLGLDKYDSAELFAAENDISDVRRIAERIAGERL